MWMFGILSSALGRKCEPAHEVGKDSKAYSAVPASLVSRVSCGLHLMNFNLNVTIFTEWQLDVTVHDWRATSVGVWARAVTDSLIVLWSPRERAVLQEENVESPGRCLQKVYLGSLHIETSLGSCTISGCSVSLLEGIWNLEGWASTHLGQEVPVWWDIRTRRWPRGDLLYG